MQLVLPSLELLHFAPKSLNFGDQRLHRRERHAVDVHRSDRLVSSQAEEGVKVLRGRADAS